MAKKANGSEKKVEAPAKGKKGTKVVEATKVEAPKVSSRLLQTVKTVSSTALPQSEWKEYTAHGVTVKLPYRPIGWSTDIARHLAKGIDPKVEAAYWFKRAVEGTLTKAPVVIPKKTAVVEAKVVSKVEAKAAKAAKPAKAAKALKTATATA